jgi:ribosomal protein S14
LAAEGQAVDLNRQTFRQLAAAVLGLSKKQSG